MHVTLSGLNSYVQLSKLMYACFTYVNTVVVVVVLLINLILLLVFGPGTVCD